MPAPFFDMVTRRDARLLARWWGARPGPWQYSIRRSPSNARYWAVYRSR